MSFAAPIWLVGLLPWAALVAWLLSGRRRDARVPFLHLWPTDAAPVRVKRAMHVPPLAVIFVLVAILLALLGAAGPVVPSLGGVTLVVDRHVATAATDDLLVSARDALRRFEWGPVDFVLIPDGRVERTDQHDWITPATAAPLVTIDTSDALRSAVKEALQRNAWPVIVLSNRAIESADDERVVHITSDARPANVGIVRVAARETPAGQVMVTIRNRSPHRSAEIVVNTDGQSHRRPIDLPADGSEKSYFVDLPKLGTVVAVEVGVRDDVAADNRAWLVRRASAPRIEVQSDVPPEIARMADVYQELRPAAGGSTRVIVTREQAEDSPAVIVASDGATRAIDGDGPLRVVDHPVTANVDWARVTSGARVAEISGSGWAPVVTRGGRVLVAVRGEDTPAEAGSPPSKRQVWVGVASETWARESDFVVFWTNVFDWLGRAGAETFTAERTQILGGDWRRSDELSGSPALPVTPAPGVWRRADGEAVRALNFLDVKLDPPPSTDWRRKIAELKPQPTGRANLRSGALVAAVVSALIASLTWASVKAGPAAA